MLHGFEVEESKEDRIIFLRKKVKEANDEFFDNDNSIITDEEYDTLRDELELLSPNDKVLKQIGAPIKATKWDKLKHKIAMGSLNKVKSIKELNEKWISKYGYDRNLILSLKLDGISIDLEYEEGILVAAITRGTDGIEGENIFDNVKLMKNVKQELPTDFSGSIRGEIILYIDDYNEINNILKDNDDKLFKTVRNATSGIARRFDHRFSEYLKVIYYDVTGDFDTKEEQLYLISNIFKLEIVDFEYIHEDTLNNIESIYGNYERELRNKLKYQIDGLVIEVNDREVFEEAGLVNNRPKAAVALKFGSIRKESILFNIVCDMGNTGVLTPVAVFDPIEIDGTITRASLHNLSIFKSFNLRKGDKIIIKKANDIIPQLVEVIESSNGPLFEYPKICPVCGEKTSIRKTNASEFLMCSNDVCAGKEIGAIKKWCSSIGLQSKGVGEKFIERVYNEKLIRYSFDLYNLKEDDISKLERYGDISAKKVLDIINSHKEVELHEFIGGLNIKNFGKSMAKKLIEAGHDSFDKIDKLTIEDLKLVDGIEEITAKSFFDGFNEKFDLSCDLFSCGIKIKTVNKDKKLSFCFTGKVESINEDGDRYTRGKLIDIVNHNGAEVLKSVTKGLDFLVVADANSTSTKAKKARNYGTKVIDDKEFLQMFNK